MQGRPLCIGDVITKLGKLLTNCGQDVPIFIYDKNGAVYPIKDIMLDCDESTIFISMNRE